MTTATAPEQTKAVARATEPTLTTFEVIERVITAGDLGRMTPAERIDFYWRTCESLGLNPLTRPFEFITLNGKLTMYARKDATDQLRKINVVTVTSLTREKDDELGLITVNARGRDKTGREDEATGVVNIKGLSGEALANALMKAETKAKRRLTLSLVGLGFLDESEVEGAERVDVDPQTGEITERAKPKSLLESVREQQEAMAPKADAPAETSELDDIVDGLFTEDAPAARDLADTIRASAEASELKGVASDEQQGRLNGLLIPLGKDQAIAGVTALWPDAAADGKLVLSAARADALIKAAESLGDRFAEEWRTLAGEAAA